MMTSAKLRKAFLEFFQSKEHTIVPSSPLVPQGDPTLLFTNAGMVQFKDVFLGLEKRPYQRATTAQKCLRAGGKHNDLDNVGYTARHHTFFEMLGNFSFGDYFKKTAIQYAWEFLTQTLKLPKEKLWITVYQEDDESAEIWVKEIGIPPERVIRCGEKDNFWSMGDTGPCGPCSEIYYDHGPEIPGGLPGSADAEGDRYVEIWNLVFMQYERHADGTMTPLPKPSVDTGMGLERVAAVMQGVHNNYDIDMFKHIIHAAAKLAKIKDTQASSLRVLADHIRSTSFLIADGVIPSNEGRGYVLRRIIRRAIRHGYQLGMSSPFFYRLVKPLVEVMSDAYPELAKMQLFIEKTLQKEEEQFALTLDQGMKILQQAITQLSSNIIPGEVVFRLYDTFGFPMDLTADIAREKKLIIDEAGFHQEMEKQRKRSQETSKFYMEYIPSSENTEFIGYEQTELKNAVILDLYEIKKHKAKDSTEKAIFKRLLPVELLEVEQSGVIILDRTPFYAEGGGQVGDEGVLLGEEGAEFIVINTYKNGNAYVHEGYCKKGIFRKHNNIIAKVTESERRATELNHSATHLLHAALRQLLGTHVQQKGSLVAPDRLRFDFSHPSSLTETEIQAIENLVNEKIRANFEGKVVETTPDDAIAQGAVALFGEKYGDKVRTLKFGDFSYELCGGTHVGRTGDIGVFKIIGETGIAAGIRRIEAITGNKAIEWMQEADRDLRESAKALKTDRENTLQKLQQLLDNQKQLQKENEQLKGKLASKSGDDLLNQFKEMHGTKVLVTQIEHADMKVLRDMIDQLKQKIGSGIIVLASTQAEKVSLIVGVTKDLAERFPANQLIQPLAERIGGKGGGRPDLAQAGGDKPEGLSEVLNVAFLEKVLGKLV